MDNNMSPCIGCSTANTVQLKRKAGGLFPDTLGRDIFAPGCLLIFRPYRLIVFISSYILIGGDIIRRAFKNVLHGQVFDETFL